MKTAAQKAIGYIRVSTEEQSREGISLDMQAVKIRQYAELNDLTLVDIIQDAGISAKSIKGRPGILSILEMVKARKIDAVIVYKLDRLARNTGECLAMASLMDKAGVALHSITEKLDTQSALGRFFFTLTASLAEMERNLISERTKAALGVKRDNGQRISGHAPFGYRFENDRLVKDDKEQEIIGKIHELSEKGLSIRGIVAFLKEHGYRNRHERPLGRNEVWTVLKKAA